MSVTISTNPIVEKLLVQELGGPPATGPPGFANDYDKTRELLRQAIGDETMIQSERFIFFRCVECLEVLTARGLQWSWVTRGAPGCFCGSNRVNVYKGFKETQWLKNLLDNEDKLANRANAGIRWDTAKKRWIKRNQEF